MVDRDFLGRGLAFPVRTEESGAVETAVGETDVAEAIRIVLGTAPGERVMRPRFGCGIHERVFEVVDTTTRTLIEDEALIEWEPRIEVLDVSVADAPEREGTVLVEVDYRVRATNVADNLVYPFYMGGG